MSPSTYKRRHRATLREEGRCINCPHPAEPYRQCETCRAKAAIRSRRYRQRRAGAA